MAVFSDIFAPVLDNQRVLICLFLTVVLFYFLQRRKYNLPPGPLTLPFIGSLPSIALNLYRTGYAPEQLFAKLSKQHGDDVISLQVGNKVVVILNGCKVIKDAYQNPNMNDRPYSKLFEEAEYEEGIIFTSGKSWKTQRTLTMNAFRNFGVGRSTFEGNITEEAKVLIQTMSQYDAEPFDPRNLIGTCVSNVICAVTFGQRYDHSDPDFQHLLSLVNENANYMGSGGVVLYVPMFRYIVPKIYGKVLANLLAIKKFANGILDRHISKFHSSNIHDFMDVYLTEIEKKTQADNNFHVTTPEINNHDKREDFINLKSLTSSALGLFLAGTETSATTLRWALLYMLTYPDIQAKVQQELDAVIGQLRMPQWTDRISLPFTEAVLLEVQRIRTIMPLGFPHVAAEDTKLGDYDIPKGSIIVSNLWAVHNDTEVWVEPDQFKPERFLDKDGKLRHRKEFMPFSAGHRVCLGENLAKMELFLFFTYILHTFTIKSPSGKAQSLEGIGGVTFSPLDFEIIADRRDL